ncbi:uncharacterized protein VP01_270g2 [Puccinia sorghi]|uniref:Myb/SANT-like domain-containing protein n=1 Tax=Puccinia sorghi TaxID=27349 RepID=A0A0L6V471_9BASI|nr:uncharacterized protein VP01_270g2 [Puccinia sorghi]
MVNKRKRGPSAQIRSINEWSTRESNPVPLACHNPTSVLSERSTDELEPLATRARFHEQHIRNIYLTSWFNKDPMFLEVSISQPPVSNPNIQSTPNANIPQSTPNMKIRIPNKRKPLQRPIAKTLIFGPPKQKILELIIDYTCRGHTTDNANLKKDTWVALANNLNKDLNTSLQIQLIWNPKGLEEDTLIFQQCHPNLQFLYRGKSFPWYDLLGEVFLGAVSSGPMAKKIFPVQINVGHI